MEMYDDDLSRFAAEGAAPLPVTNDQGYVEHNGARIWYATYGSGSPVILLHGGLGHRGNWGYQVPALVRSSYRAIVIDSRGHGRSTRDARPFMYELMAFDVSAVIGALHIEKAALVGWSDGACTALILASYGIHSDSQALYRPTLARLQTTIGHAGPIRRVFCCGQPHAENAT
jgi:alpha/beta hydrolase fold